MYTRKLSGYMFLLAASLFIMWNTFSAKAQSTASCQSLTPEFTQLTSGAYWLDENTVAFEVTNGESPSGIFTRIDKWYTYDFAQSVLTELLTSPFDPSLNPLQIPNATLTEPTLREMNLLSAENALIYSQIQGDYQRYWYFNRQTGLQLDLGFQIVRGGFLFAIWSADETKAIISAGGNIGFPIQLIQFNGGVAQITPLEILPEFQEMGLQGWNFEVVGLRPDGSGIIIKPNGGGNLGLLENSLVLFDLTARTWTSLSIEGANGIRWLDNDTFLALLSSGIIEYHLDTYTYDILITAQQLGNRTSGSLSPNGQYFIRQWSQTTNVTTRGIEACSLTYPTPTATITPTFTPTATPTPVLKTVILSPTPANPLVLSEETRAWYNYNITLSATLTGSECVTVRLDYYPPTPSNYAHVQTRPKRPAGQEVSWTTAQTLVFDANHTEYEVRIRARDDSTNLTGAVGRLGHRMIENTASGCTSAAGFAVNTVDSGGTRLTGSPFSGGNDASAAADSRNVLVFTVEDND